MKKQTAEEFGGRLPHMGARLYDENVCNMAVLDAGYKIVAPMAKDAAPYLSLEKGNSQMHVEDFMVCIGKVKCGNTETKLYESDVVDFCHKDYRGLGAVVYVPEKFMWALKDTKTRALYPLGECRLNIVFGTLYSCENILGLEIDKAYDFMRRKMPLPAENPPCSAGMSDIKKSVDEKVSLKTAASSPAAVSEGTGAYKASGPSKADEDRLSIYINVFCKDNVTNWTYTLLHGTHIKTDAGSFKRQGDFGYYEAAAGIIALSKVTKPRPICIYTPDRTIALLFEKGRLETWAKNGWKKASGQTLKNQPLLEELYENMERLGGNITAQLCSSDFRLAV